MSTAEMLAAIVALPVDERTKLVEAIVDSIPAETDESGIPQTHKDLLDQRLAAFAADPKAGSSLDEVFARLQEEL